MPYDETLAARMRGQLDGLAGLSEKRMFGGLCFLIDGNMVGGARRLKDGEAHFLFRVGKDNENEALGYAGTRPMVHAGRKMGGFVYLDAEAADAETMRALTALALSFVTALPPKKESA